MRKVFVDGKEFQIKKNVPSPVRKGVRGRTRSLERRVIDLLKINETVVLPAPPTRQLRSLIYAAGFRNGKKFSIQTVDGKTQVTRLKIKKVA